MVPTAHPLTKRRWHRAVREDVRCLDSGPADECSRSHPESADEAFCGSAGAVSVRTCVTVEQVLSESAHGSRANLMNWEGKRWT